MSITRRQVLWGMGGGVAGLVATPVPWKLLDDVAIWTQRRRGLPEPPRGEVSVRRTACTLCPAGCALRIRCVGTTPVGSVGTRDPLAGGACVLGLTIHHLALHPLRRLQPGRLKASGGREALLLDSALAMVAESVGAAQKARHSIMILDRRPGRAISGLYRRLLGTIPGGVYVTTSGEDATLKALEGASQAPLGIDLERTRTLVSFGAPILDGWGRPGWVLAQRPHLRLIQLDTWRSPTAALADEWLALRPGSEGRVALALAWCLVRDGRTGAQVWAESLRDFSPDRVAEQAGIEAPRLEALARSLLSGGPAVAVGGGEPGGGPLTEDDERAIALLNVVLGSAGRPGGIVARPSVPGLPEPASAAAVRSLASVPDRSVGALLLDGADDGRALPWSIVDRVLAPDALVVSLSAFEAGLARHARLWVPSPAPLEIVDEVLPTVDSVAARYGVAAAISPAPAGATDPVAFLTSLAAILGTPLGAPADQEALVRQRVASIRSGGRGHFLSRGEIGYESVFPSTDDEAWSTLLEGGLWIDDGGVTPSRRISVPRPDADALGRGRGQETNGEDPLYLVTFAARGTAGDAPISPLLTKIYQESDLRLPATIVSVHPDTARRRGLREGRSVRIESASGSFTARLQYDHTMPADRIAVAAGPSPASLHPGRDAAEAGALSVAVADRDGTWRGTRVRVQEA